MASLILGPIQQRVKDGNHLVKSHAVIHALKEGFDRANMVEAVLCGRPCGYVLNRTFKLPQRPRRCSHDRLALATLPAGGPTGGFFHDRRPIEW